MYGITTDYASPTVEKAPTLMEALVRIQERLTTLEAYIQKRMLYLEARIVDLETGNDEREYERDTIEVGEISGEYYGDGMRGEHNAE